MGLLRGMFATADVLLSQTGSDVVRVVREVGGMLCAPQMDDDRIRTHFGRRGEVESAEVLERSAQEEVPAEIRVNHRIAAKNRGDALKPAAMHMATGRTIVFPWTQARKM